MNMSQFLPKAVAVFVGVTMSLGTYAQMQQLTDFATAMEETPVGEFQPEPFEYVDHMLEPQVLNYREVADAIDYPSQAVDAGIEGSVMIRILVDGEGNYVNHLVTASPDPMLTKAVNQQVRMLAFEPGYLKGKPASGWVSTMFRFRLGE